MSLGICITNKYGVAIGTDSLVSQQEGFFDVPIDRQILSMFNLIEVKLSAGEKVSVEEMKAMTEVARDRFVASITHRTVKSFRSKKLFPFFYRANVPYGGIITVGNGKINDLVLQAINKYERTSDYQTLSEDDFIEKIMVIIKRDISNLKFSSYRRGDFLLTTFCPEASRPSLWILRVAVDPEASEEERCQCVLFKDTDDDWRFTPIGDKTVVDRLILGRDTALPELLDEEIMNYCDLIEEIYGTGKEANTILVEKTKLIEIARSANDCEFDETWQEAKGMFPEGSYNEEQKTLSGRAILVFFQVMLRKKILRKIRGENSIGHLEGMTLRECLRVIDWLIDSTGQFHTFIKNSIPTVGGDVYLATITQRDGFVYRNINDTF